MVLKVKKYPDPVLKKKAEKVIKIEGDIHQLLLDMAETMERNQGVGLAAPQVGISKRIIVVKNDKGFLGLINPVVKELSKEKETLEEGCLCFPNVFLKIKRPHRVKIEAQNEKGEVVKIDAEGMAARVLQHEIDHLDGILIIDKIPFYKRSKVKKQINESNRKAN